MPGPAGNGNTTVDPVPPPALTPQPPNFTLVGRFSPGPAQPKAAQVMSWAGSAVLARVFGTRSVTLHTTASTVDVALTVALDGNAPIAVTDPNLQLTGLDPSLPHTVRLTKINEAQYGLATFLGMEVDAGTGHFTTAPAPSARRIEIVGDSISNGYGDLGPNANCAGTAANEDAAQAYGPLTGAALGADVMVTAWAGHGMLRNYGGDTADVLPQLWLRRVATDASAPWDPNEFKPQAVVIDLGTNDIAQGIPDAGQFEQAYTQFIGALRAAYGKDTHIFCAVGPMLSGDNLTTQRADIQAVVAAANSGGDANVHFIEFPALVIDANGNGAGCYGHPNLAGHRSMAAALTSALKQALSW